MKSRNLVMLPFAREKAKPLYEALSRDPYELFLTSSQMAFPVTAESFERYVSDAERSGTHEIFSFLDKHNETLAGHCELKAISTRHLHATIANVFILPSHRGKGWGVQMIQQMLQHAFETKGLQRVGLAVHTNNTPAVAMYIKAGLQIEGTIRDVLRFQEKNYSLYQMSILSREWKPI